MQLHPVFVRNIQSTYGENGKVWLSQLPQHIEKLSQQWNFQFIEPIARLTYSFVALVQLRQTQEIVILKMAPDSQRILTEARWLQNFNQGVAKVYGIDEENSAFLLEYLKPGLPLNSLVASGQDEAATRILCQTILVLQSQSPKTQDFPHLAELINDLHPLQGHIDNYTFTKVMSLFTSLTADRSRDVLLHGDLHHDNILSHGNDWKAIDPHGYIGDPAAEVGVLLRNPMKSFPTDKPLFTTIESRLKVLAEELPFDAKKMQAWAFCMTLLSAAWTLEDFDDADISFEIEIATAIDRVK